MIFFVMPQIYVHVNMSDWVFKLSQEITLPGPREELKIDGTSGDAELFLKYFSPTGTAHIDHLGDLWRDVSWLYFTSV